MTPAHWPLYANFALVVVDPVNVEVYMVVIVVDPVCVVVEVVVVVVWEVLVWVAPSSSRFCAMPHALCAPSITPKSITCVASGSPRQRTIVLAKSACIFTAQI